MNVMGLAWSNFCRIGLACAWVAGCGSSTTASRGAPPDDAGVTDSPAMEAGLNAGGDPPACQTTMGGGPTPVARGDVAGALDSDGTAFVVFGGDEGVPPCNGFAQHKHVGDTWVLDTACGVWHQAQSSGPPARARHSMALDTSSGKAFLFGGRTSSGTAGPYTLFNDVWSFDFATESWAQIQTSGQGPSARSNTAIAVDPEGHELVVFGGNTDTTGLAFTPLNDTFVLDLGTGAWRQIAQNPAPSARLFHAMAVDPEARKVYVWSGGDANAFTGPFLLDVWALDLASESWSQVQTGGMPPNGRIKHGLAFDTVGKRLVTFGGHDDGAVGNENDLYVLDITTSPATWSKLPPGDTENKPSTGTCMFPPDFTVIDKSAPERRDGFAFGARADGRAFVVFGGYSDCGLLADAWWWADGSQVWTPTTQSPVGLSCLRVQTSCTSLCN
jgi:hypothetical protein